MSISVTVFALPLHALYHRCYVTLLLCHAILLPCHAILVHVIAMPCHVHAWPCHVKFMPCYVCLCYCHAVLYLIILLPCHALPCYFHAMLCYVHHVAFMLLPCPMFNFIPLKVHILVTLVRSWLLWINLCIWYVHVVHTMLVITSDLCSCHVTLFYPHDKNYMLLCSWT